MTKKMKKTEIGEIPEDWELKEIGSLVEIDKKNLTKKNKFEEMGYIDINSVSEGHILNRKAMYVNNLPSRARRLVENDDIILSTVRPNLRHFAILKNPSKNTVVSTGFAVITATEINPDFLFYYLSTKKYTNYLVSIADSHTSAYPAFNTDVIKSSYVPFPLLPEQRAIAKILSDLDSKIELLQKQNQTLEEIGQAIFKHWFIDFDFPDENGNPYKSSGGEMVYSEELGKEIPEGWEVKKLKEVVSQLKPGTNYQPKKVQSGIPFVNVRNLKNGFLDLSDVKYITDDEFLRVHKSWKPEEHDVLITRIGTLGNVAVIRKNDLPIAVHYNSIDLKEKKPFSFQFIYFLLKSKAFQEKYHSKKKQSVQEYVTIDEVENLDLILPKSERKLIFLSQIFKSLFYKLEINQNKIESLQETGDILLPKLMSGKIRVKI
ncbi:MAG: restriction endonuclease subunit S [Nanoarchaeota archaeon]